MARDWKEVFSRWSKPLSDTEEAKASHAADMVRDAVKAHAPLAARRLDVYATGSVRNNTNVRAESDIDVAIVCHESIYYKLPDGTDAATFGITTPAAYSFAQFRNDLEAALRAKFGSAVKPTDKTFDVPENTYRMEADVTPFFEYRRYSGSGRADLQWAYEEGVMSVSKSGLSFTNWHADHYREGVGRNDTTRKRFKRVVRILKNTKIDMLECGTDAARASASKIPSFLIECLVFNAPDTCFNKQEDGYVDDVRAAIAHLWGATKEEGAWRDLLEVSRRKRLFLDGQPWTKEEANAFLLSAWQHLEFR
ncbi:MAG: nucleotidyltransferase [Polyangiaceae bacterium]